MSLKSAIVMYRVDGVSGLNDLTGIKSKNPSQQLLERRTINPGPARARLSARNHAVPLPEREGAQKVAKPDWRARVFWKQFGPPISTPNPLLLQAYDSTEGPF